MRIIGALIACFILFSSQWTLSKAEVCRGTLNLRRCPRHDEANVRFEQIVEKRYAGQIDAVQIVQQALLRYMYSDGDRIAMMHFSGPTGVGKTYLSELLGEALFTEKTKAGYCGVLSLRMSPLLDQQQGKEREIADMYLHRPIAAQLSRCPRSLIVIDDVQFVPPSILRSLKPLLESQPTVTSPSVNDGQPVSAAGAFIVLISDLETHQETILNASVTKADATKALRTMALKQWGAGVNDAVNQLDVVPFLQLTRQELRKSLQIKFAAFGETVRAAVQRENGALAPRKVYWRGALLLRKGALDAVINAVGMNSINRSGVRAFTKFIDYGLYKFFGPIVTAIRTAQNVDARVDASSARTLFGLLGERIDVFSSIDVWVEHGQLYAELTQDQRSKRSSHKHEKDDL